MRKQDNFTDEKLRYEVLRTLGFTASASVSLVYSDMQHLRRIAGSLWPLYMVGRLASNSRCIY